VRVKLVTEEFGGFCDGFANEVENCNNGECPAPATTTEAVTTTAPATTTELEEETTTEAVPKCFDVTITTKQYGNENSWTLGTCVSDAAGYQADQVYSEECCLEAGQYTLTCDDSYKDGWHGGFITIQGKQYCEDFTDGHQQAQDIDIAYSG